MNNLSKVTVIAIVILLTATRIHYAKWESQSPINVLTWDAFGYYLYLPGLFIYHDIKQLEWVPGIKEKYQTTGTLYQISDLPNGNKAIKYLGGIAILYSPFFLAGHITAGWLDYPQDGFSTPYQLAICIAALFYAFLGLWVLRRVLLRYFSDTVTALTLVLIALATNFLQYVSVDSAQTHGFIFTLYVFLLAATIHWHERPTYAMAFLTGGIIGLGVISRPTEIVMLFIPFLYGMNSANSKKEKWQLVNQHRSHVLMALAGGIICTFPQLLYWKVVAGNWIYDVGSKWTFLQPNWQVLFGWEKGWFIYTPVVIFMVWGLFSLRKNPFYWSVLIYFLLNTWIFISWDDWRYGASYSSRVLVQSYAIMSLPMAMMIQKLLTHPLKYITSVVTAFLVFLNLFQIWQYNKGILHYNDMNRRYYQAIYLNPNPTPLQMSLLDTKEFIRNENKYKFLHEIKIDSQFMINVSKIPQVTLYKTELKQINGFQPNIEQWLKISARVHSSWGAFDTNLSTRLIYDGKSKQTNCRMQNGISENTEWNIVEYYFQIPIEAKKGSLTIFAETKTQQDIHIKDMSVTFLEKK